MSDFNVSDYINSELADESNRRRYAQNSLIVDAAVALNYAFSASQLTQKELAVRLGRTEGYVSQVLSGGGNLTLRTLGDIAYGLHCNVEIALRPKDAVTIVVESPAEVTWFSTAFKPVKAANTQLALAA